MLRQYGIPEGIVTIIQNLYKDRKSNVKINGMSGEWFEVVTGVRQGCALFIFFVCDSAGLGIGKILENYKGGLE